MTDTHKILILFAHPALHRSRVNRPMIKGVAEIDGVTFHDLYEAYPDFHIDVPREQALLLEHDIILFHHPFYWYSSPALLKEWFDQVLVYGWAFGADGRALEGRKTLTVITAGGGEASYGPGNLNQYTIREFLRPIEQTARLCHMEYLPPFVILGTHKLVPAKVSGYAADYRALLTGLRDGTLDLAGAGADDHINDYLDRHA